jgi:hypothetical protein
MQTGDMATRRHGDTATRRHGGTTTRRHDDTATLSTLGISGVRVPEWAVLFSPKPAGPVRVL